MLTQEHRVHALVVLCSQTKGVAEFLSREPSVLVGTWLFCPAGCCETLKTSTRSPAAVFSVIKWLFYAEQSLRSEMCARSVEPCQQASTSPLSSDWTRRLSSARVTQTGSSQRAVTRLCCCSRKQQVGSGTVEPRCFYFPPSVVGAQLLPQKTAPPSVLIWQALQDARQLYRKQTDV